MTMALRHRRPHQPHFPEWAPATPLDTREHAATALGAFYEHLTAALVGGHRVRVDRGHGDNPDVVTDDGNLFESKATLSLRWVLNREQHDAFATKPHAYYVLWAYQAGPHPLKDFGTVHALYRWCGAHVRHAYVVAAHLVAPILAHSSYARPRYSNRRWGWNYFLFERRIQQILAGNAHRNPIPPFTYVVREDFACAPDAECFPLKVCDVDVVPFPVTYVVPTSYFVRAHDQVLAAAALRELEQERLRVVLVPSTYPGARHKIRVVASENPWWYRAYLSARLHQPGARGSRRRRPHPPGDRRRRVRAMLERLAAGQASPQAEWTGWELLSLLRDAERLEGGRR